MTYKHNITHKNDVIESGVIQFFFNKGYLRPKQFQLTITGQLTHTGAMLKSPPSVGHGAQHLISIQYILYQTM